MAVSDIWNQVSETWGGTTLVWNYVVSSLTNPGGAPGDYLDWDYQKKRTPIQEEFVKIFITVHNQFLTEEQKKFFKLAKVYPTYAEKFKIKKEEKVVLKEYKLKNNIDLKKTVNVTDIKIGLNRIEDYVKNKPKE